MAAALLLGAAGCGDDSHDVVPRNAGTSTSRPAQPAARAGFAGSTDECATFDLQSIRGQRLATAIRRARASGCDVRAATIDGRAQVVTDDRVPYRVDVSVEDDIVTSVGDVPGRDADEPEPAP